MMFLSTVTVFLLPTVFSATKTAAPSAVTKATRSNLSHHHQGMGICEDRAGRIRMHGSVWQDEPCVRCSCTQSQVRCLRIKCSENHDRCKKGERMERKQNECCAKCTPVKGICIHEGNHYEDGITWRSDPGTLCKCQMGIAVCNNGDLIGDPNAIAADEPQKSPSKLRSEEDFTLTVVSGEPTVISTHYLWYNKSHIEDDSDIIFTLVRRLTPADGRLLVAGYPQTNEVTSFSQKDLITERVIYIPPVTFVATSLIFHFVVWKYPERVNLTGEESFIVRVLPSEDKEPEFEIQNPSLRIDKGGSACISRNYFNVDISERNLRYVIVEAPNYGTLKFFFENGSTVDIFEGFEFGESSLHSGSMCYDHVWRNKHEDYFEILATDGRMEAVNQFRVLVKEEKRFREIKPMVLFEGERITLASEGFGIPAKEAGRQRERKMYQLLARPKYGHLYTREQGGRQAIPLDARATFEEEDIEEGRLMYSATEEIGSMNLTDTLTFSVKPEFDVERIDEVEIPIVILPVDNQPPTLVVNGHVVVGEGSEETLPFSLLTITDVDTLEEDLLLEIVRKPFFGEVRAFRGNSDPKPVNWFSVQELRDGKVSYSQSYNSRVEPVEDVILLRASDGKQWSQLARINISIELTNDEPPEVLTSVLHVDSGQGGRVVVIDDGAIYVQDADTDAREITVTITRLPTQGVLRRREFEWRAAGSGHSLSANHSLTYAELVEGLLTYKTAFGAQETEDSFEFRVSDGEFSVSGTLSIVIASPEPAAKPSNWKTSSTGNGSSSHKDGGASSSTYIDRALESRAGTTAIEIPRHRGPPAVLPYRPHVASAAEIEDGNNGRHPGPGSPLVCILPCHPRHPLYASKRHVCFESTQPEERVSVSWEVSVPLDLRRNSFLPFEPLTESTLFSDARGSTLDPLYFARGFRVRCVAATEGGGIPLKSDHVTVDGSPKCSSSDRSRLDRPYSATLSYVEPTDSKHPNTFSVKLSIPHEDGMVPLVSTHPLTDPQLLLSLDSPFRSQHACSNLNPGKAFVEDFLPNQESGSHALEEEGEEGGGRRGRRGNLVAMDRHLDPEECIWYFEGWFGMGTLVDECGGRVVSDQKTDKEGQRYLMLQVPLHISLVFAAGASKWAVTEYRTVMEFSMRYSSILWNKGFHTEPMSYGRIQTTNTAVDDAGRLAIVLRTKTLFRGHFLLHGKGTADHTLASMALPPQNLRAAIKLTLELLHTQDLSDTSEQVWSITSDVAIDDYTGEYSLHLIPCMEPPSKLPSADNVTEESCLMLSSPIEITFWVRFKQVGRPQPAAYSLHTEFVLTKQPPLHFERNVIPRYDVQNEEPSPEAYLPGDDIYGLVMWHPSQDLTNMYRLSIQRLYLCSGKQGLIPNYDPTGEIYGNGPQYGCMQPSKYLKHRFVLLDMQRHENMKNGYDGITFEVFLAKEIAAFKNLLTYSGVDGFAMKVDPLFEINAGLQWYLQVLYSISSKNDRQRRSLENADKSSQLSTLNSTKIELQTNMKQILLDTKNLKLIAKEKAPMHLAILAGISLVSLVILSIYLMKKKTNLRVFYPRPEFISANSNNYEQNEPLNVEITSENKIEDKMKVALVTENKAVKQK